MKFTIKNVGDEDILHNQVEITRTATISTEIFKTDVKVDRMPSRIGGSSDIRRFFSAGFNHRFEDGKLVRDFVQQETKYEVEIENMADFMACLSAFGPFTVTKDLTLELKQDYFQL